MIWHAARKEITEIIRDGRFLWSSMIIVLLLLVSLGAGAQRYVEDRNLRAAASTEDRTQWLSQGTKAPHTAAHYGVYAFKPATPLALFDPGYNDYTGTIQYLEAHKENQASFKAAADATALQRFGDLSGAMVLQLLVPLLIILLCFGMISGEREDGTLRQLLSIGVPRSTLVWGKAAGVSVALGIVLLPAVVVGLLIAAAMTGHNDPHEMIDFPAKLLTIGLSYAVFYAIIICIALTVSIVFRSSGAALTTLIGFWIVSALLIPRLATDISKVVYRTPSAFEVAAAIDEGRSTGPHPHEPNHPNYIAFKAQTLKQYHVEREEDLPMSFVGFAMQADEEWGFKVFDRTYGRLRSTFEKQNRLQQLFSVLSPFVAIKSLSAALSGTDVAFSSDFSRAGEMYRRNMVRILNGDLMRNTAGRTSYAAEWGYSANADLWKKVPPFDFDPPSLATILNRNVAPVAILLGWLAAALLVLGLAARRTKIDL